MEIGYDEETSVLITLSGDSASCDSDAVQISGTTVTITDEGTYIDCDGTYTNNGGDVTTIDGSESNPGQMGSNMSAQSGMGQGR